MQVSPTVQAALAARIAPAAPVFVRAEPIASAAVIFPAVAQVTGMRSAGAPEDLTDPTRAATAIVASPAWDLAVAASIVAAEGSVAVVEASAEVAVEASGEAAAEVVEAAGVAVVAGAGKLVES
jgi:hypothetical protein